MNKIIGIIIAFIAPIVFFFIFDYFDIYQVIGRKNQPKLPRYLPITEVVADSANAKRVNDTLWHVVPPFSFMAHNGKTVTEQDFKNKIWVVDFFFANCPGICPKMTNELKRVQREFRTDTALVILSHTVDPVRDTLEALQRYAEANEVDSTRWLLLTGDKKAIYDQARHGYYVSASEGDGGPEDFVHTEKFVLVDKDRIIRGFYDGTNPEEVNKMMTDIRVLELEYAPSFRDRRHAQ